MKPKPARATWPRVTAKTTGGAPKKTRSHWLRNWLQTTTRTGAEDWTYRLSYAASLTDEQRTLLKTSADKCYAQFVNYVTTTPLIPQEVMQGQCFDSQEALINGLIDGVIVDPDGFVDYLNSR